MAFCLSGLGSNPKTDLGFLQFRIYVYLFSLGIGFFWSTCKRTRHILSPSFLVPITIYRCKQINCNLAMYKEKDNEHTKRGRKRPIFKNTYHGASVRFFLQCIQRWTFAVADLPAEPSRDCFEPENPRLKSRAKTGPPFRASSLGGSSLLSSSHGRASPILAWNLSSI